MKYKWANILAGILAYKLQWVALVIALIAIGSSLDYHTYWGSTSEPVTVAWDTADGAVRYEYRAYNPERELVVVSGSTQAHSVTIGFPKAGHYIVQVRSCSKESECEYIADGDPNNTGSVWISSTDPLYAQVDGQPKGWWVYRYLAAAEDLEFGN